VAPETGLGGAAAQRRRSVVELGGRLGLIGLIRSSAKRAIAFKVRRSPDTPGAIHGRGKFCESLYLLLRLFPHVARVPYRIRTGRWPIPDGERAG
jgi:hypothetical protein